MANLLDGIKPILLMGPGPSAVPGEVYAALGKPTLVIGASSGFAAITEAGWKINGK